MSKEGLMLFTSLSIRMKLFLSFGLILVMLLVANGAALYGFQTMQKASEKIILDAIPIGKLAESLLMELINEETGVRGYLISGDKSYLEPYNAGKKNIQQTFTDMEKFFPAHPIMADLIKNSAKPQIEAVEKYFASQIALVEAGNIEEARKRAGDGKNLMDAYRATHDKIRADIVKLTNDGWEVSKNAKNTATWTMAILFLISVVLGVSIALLISRMIATRLNANVNILSEIAAGNLTVQEIKIAADDEIGKIGTTVNKMSGNLRNLVKNVAQSAEQLAASSEQLTASAEQSAQASNQVASTITEVANGAESQAQAINNTSAAVEKISASIKQAVANTTMAAKTTDKTAAAAQDGLGAIATAIEQMSSIETTVNSSAGVVSNLGNRSKEIGQIVDTISGIAGQTNLLALNAAIEAARAGEQGRGFAVVAEEVRRLAEQSQEAAKQIAALIGEIQNDTDKAVIAMNAGTSEVKKGTEVVASAGQSFDNIAQLVTEVSRQITEVSSVMQEIARGSQQIVDEVHAIDDISRRALGHTQTVSAATEEQSASMEEIAASSQNLARMAEELQKNIQQFRV